MLLVNAQSRPHLLLISPLANSRVRVIMGLAAAYFTPNTGTKLYCLVTEKCVQFVDGHNDSLHSTWTHSLMLTNLAHYPKRPLWCSESY